MGREQLEITFIKKPRIPFSLIVNISTKETIIATKNDVSGPKIKPLIAMIISFGSYFKKSTSGTRPITLVQHCLNNNE